MPSSMDQTWMMSEFAIRTALPNKTKINDQIHINE